MKTSKETNKNIHKTFMITTMIIIGVVSLLIGMILGIVLQQIIIYKAFIVVAPAFDGVEVNIDFNETLVVDEMSKIALDLFRETHNNTNNIDVNQNDRFDSNASDWKDYTYGDPHSINIDGLCPGRNITKTVAQCIKEVESKSDTISNCTGGYCSW